MKKNILFTVFAIFTLFAAFTLCSTNTFGTPTKSGSESTYMADQITTITVTITAIDLVNNKITLKDQNGKIYVFVVDTQLIDLKKYKVGENFTATISTTVTSDKVTRARITKTQLIRLQ
jgi:hypothetical protein